METKNLISQSVKTVNTNKFILSLYNLLTKEVKDANGIVVNKDSAKYYKDLKNRFDKDLQSISLLGVLDIDTAISLYSNGLKYSAIEVAKLAKSFEALEIPQHENVFKRAKEINALMKVRQLDNENRNPEFLALLDYFGGVNKLTKNSKNAKILLSYSPELIDTAWINVFTKTVNGVKYEGLEAFRLTLKTFEITPETFSKVNFKGLTLVKGLQAYKKTVANATTKQASEATKQAKKAS